MQVYKPDTIDTLDPEKPDCSVRNPDAALTDKESSLLLSNRNWTQKVLELDL